MNKAVIDIENGGFDKNAGMVEIGMIIVDEKYNELKRYSVIVNRYFQEGTEDLMIYDPEAEKVHGITEEMQVLEGKTPQEAVIEIEAIIQDYNIFEFIGHFIKGFDSPRLVKFFDRFSKYECEDRFPMLIDTKEIAKRDFEFDSYSLGPLCEEFGIEHNDAHRAIGDCEATLNLLIAMDHAE